jgi:hypothetical protein
MKKLKTETVLAVFCMIAGKKHYIKSMVARFDGLYLTRYVTDPNLAHDFETIENAEARIAKFVNAVRGEKRYEYEELEAVADTKKYYKELSKIK